MRQTIRLASAREHLSMLTAYAEAMGLSADEVPAAFAYVREDWVSDCPGYVGPVGIMHFNGFPSALEAFVLRDGVWMFSPRGN